MNKVKVEIMKTLITLLISGLIGYIIYRSLIHFFSLIEDIDILKMVVKCII